MFLIPLLTGGIISLLVSLALQKSYRKLTLVYQLMAAQLASRAVALRTTARHLVLFYYDEDQISLGSFLTYKILPPGTTNGSRRSTGKR